MPNLKFIEIDINPARPKATIHASGRLGFNIEAISFMDLNKKKFFKVAVEDQDGVSVNNIYLIEQESPNGAAKIAKAGDYYYLNAGMLFDDLEEDYKNFTIIYDIKKELFDGKDMFVLKKRKPIKKRIKPEVED
jgi:hypothetical protein